MSIAIIVAMESERIHLDTLMPGGEHRNDGAWTTHTRGDMVCITSGIGMVAAAAATEHAIASYNPAMVLNYGCTGAHKADVLPGDVVIGERVVHQGRMRFAPDGSIVPLDIGFHVPGEPDPVRALPCDSMLVELAEITASGINFPAWPTSPDHSPQVHTGTVSSGDVWLQSSEMITAGHARTGSLCEDMEAAAIAQICALHGVPVLTVKDISNNELLESTVFEASTSALPEGELGLRAAMVITGLIDMLERTGRVARLPYS